MNSNGHNNFTLLADSHGKVETVQEIYFKAPSTDYKTYLAPAMQALKSIRWK